jgi:hypothetical protein
MPFQAPSLSTPWSAIASIANFDAFQSLAARELLSNDDDETRETAFANYDLMYLQEIIRNNGRGLCMLPPDYLPYVEER